MVNPSYRMILFKCFVIRSERGVISQLVSFCLHHNNGLITSLPQILTQLLCISLRIDSLRDQKHFSHLVLIEKMELLKIYLQYYYYPYIFQDKQVENAHSLNKVKEQLLILIAESESDLLTLFREYLSLVGMKTEQLAVGMKR